jgi:hypothetical protein
MLRLRTQTLTSCGEKGAEGGWLQRERGAAESKWNTQDGIIYLWRQRLCDRIRYVVYVP